MQPDSSSFLHTGLSLMFQKGLEEHMFLSRHSQAPVAIASGVDGLLPTEDILRNCPALAPQVSLSSLNRHAVAVREDVGTPKAVCLQRHFARIFPEAHVDARALMYDTTTEDEVLAGSPDFVLDCIDNIDTKVGLRTKDTTRD